MVVGGAARHLPDAARPDHLELEAAEAGNGEAGEALRQLRLGQGQQRGHQVLQHRQRLREDLRVLHLHVGDGASEAAHHRGHPGAAIEGQAQRQREIGRHGEEARLAIIEQRVGVDLHPAPVEPQQRVERLAHRVDGALTDHRGGRVDRTDHDQQRHALAIGELSQRREQGGEQARLERADRLLAQLQTQRPRLLRAEEDLADHLPREREAHVVGRRRAAIEVRQGQRGRHGAHRGGHAVRHHDLLRSTAQTGRQSGGARLGVAARSQGEARWPRPEAPPACPAPGPPRAGPPCR